MDITEFERRMNPAGTKPASKWGFDDFRAARGRAVALQKELGKRRYKELNREYRALMRVETRAYGSLFREALVKSLSEKLAKRRRKSDE